MKKLLSAAFAVYMTVLSVQAQECRMTLPDELERCKKQPELYDIPEIYKNHTTPSDYGCEYGIRGKKISRIISDFNGRFHKIFPFDLNYYGNNNPFFPGEMEEEYNKDRQAAKKKKFIKTIGEFEKRFASEIKSKETLWGGDYTRYVMEGLELTVYGASPEENFRVKTADLTSADEKPDFPALLLIPGIRIGSGIEEFDKAVGWIIQREDGFIVPGYTVVWEFLIKFGEDCKISKIRFFFKNYGDLETGVDEKRRRWDSELLGFKEDKDYMFPEGKHKNPAKYLANPPRR